MNHQPTPTAAGTLDPTIAAGWIVLLAAIFAFTLLPFFRNATPRTRVFLWIARICMLAAGAGVALNAFR